MTQLLRAASLQLHCARVLRTPPQAGAALAAGLLGGVRRHLCLPGLLVRETRPLSPRPLAAHALLRADLGALLTERGEFEAAEVQLLAAHGRLEERRSKVEEEDWAQVIDRLVDLHERWGRPDEARTWEGRR